MADRILLKIVAPMVAISLMLLAMGAVAAWHVQKQQAIASNVVAREVESMLSAHDVYMGMREIRHQLNQYFRHRDVKYFNRIPPLHEETARQLERAKSLARNADEKNLIGIVDSGYQKFWARFQQINSPDFAGDRDEALAALIDEVLTRDILDPADDYINYNRKVVETTNATSRATADQMRQGFLLLGVCGGAGGLIAGLGIARAVTRSIVKLEVSIRSAAGRLTPVAGPVTFSRVAGFRELETGLKHMEAHIADVVERLERSEMEAMRNEQLAIVGQLAAGIAHELRNPLMPMKMLVQAALERDDGKGLSGRQLAVVDEEIERLERSIQSFLDFARPSPPEKSTFDLAGVIEQTLELVTAKAGRQGVTIYDDLPADPVPIEADCGQIRQVLLNLLLNALDAMPDGGRIDLEVRTRDSAAENGAGGPPMTMIRIADSGSGFDPGVVDRIFEPFVTTKETGTGLGLSICQRIVTAHGGRITARNRPEGGAEFVIRLPCSSAARPISATAASAAGH